MMDKRLFLVFVLFVVTACQPATPIPSISVKLGEEFMLIPGQSGVIDEIGLTVTLIGVPGDRRCPLEVECSESGPVTVAITLHKDSEESSDFTLEVFTNSDGRAPEGPFEGIQDRMEFGGFEIQLKAVTPHPLNFDDLIEPDEYRVSFVVEEK